jgi:hypothetical protein
MHTKGTVHILNVLQGGGAKPRLGPSVAFQNKSKCKIYSKIRSLKVRALSLSHNCITSCARRPNVPPAYCIQYVKMDWTSCPPLSAYHASMYNTLFLHTML